MTENKIRELKTEEDYCYWAKGCYELASEYYIFLFKSKEQFIDYFIPYSINIAFVCELYLKALLLNNRIDCSRKHDLYELYFKLPNDIKLQVKNYHQCGNIDKKDFETNLKDVSKAFIILRYIYERKGMGFNFQFLFELLFALHNVSTEKFI